jgi:LmbE family N-acetylglucosaminyl deacetylase
MRTDSQNSLLLTKMLSPNQSIFVLSPHLDDAVLSCGSLIAWAQALGKSVTVVNVFTKGSTLDSALTKKLLAQAQFKEAETYFAAREAEDVRALAHLGTIYRINLGCTDAAWRATYEKSTTDFPTTLDPNLVIDQATAMQLRNLLKTVALAQENTIILAPLGVGNHADHLLVRNAAAQLFKNILYYVDFPYSDKYPKDAEFIAKNYLKPTIWNEPFYEKKATAIREYKSQFAGLFPSGKMNLPLEEYYRKLSE